MEVAVQFTFRHLSDERAIFGEDLVALGVTGIFVEPVSACECVFPYLPPAEFLEVLYPHLTVCLLNKGAAGVYPRNVRSSECYEPDWQGPIRYSLEGSKGPLPSGILTIAWFATFGVSGLP